MLFASFDKSYYHKKYGIKKIPSNCRGFLFALFRYILGNNVYRLAVAIALFECSDTGNFCKQRMVFAHADVFARVHGCATLTNNDVARDNTAAAAFFNA